MGLRKACSAISGLSLVFLSLVVAAPSDATSIAIAESVQLTTITANDQWIPQFQTFDGVEMALVPPGCFLMGSTGAQVKEAIERLSSFYATSAPPWISAETPQNKVCFTQGYWIDSGLVTRDQFKSLGGRTAKSAPDNSQKEVSPVVQITWFEARDFCVKRGGRLPTEAEWEYAARGPDDLIYPGGNTIIYTGPHSPPTVGASWVGAINMAGGEWQWDSSIFKSYPFDMNDGRESGSDIQRMRVFPRGNESLS